MKDHGTDTATAGREPRLMERFRERMRLKHYSLRTEKSYALWIKQLIRFHGLRHPQTYSHVSQGAITEAHCTAVEDIRNSAYPTQPCFL